MTRWLLALILSASVIGCAEGGSDGSSEKEDEIDKALALLDAPWCEPFAAKVCAASERCGCDAVSGWPDDCLAAARAQCKRELRASADLLSEGFLVSRDGVPRCLALLDTAFDRCAATDFAQFKSECRLVVPRGGQTLPRSGQPCPGSLCGIGLRCGFDGLCHVPHPEGDRCLADSDCVVPFACRGDCNADPSCTARCVALPEPVTGSACSNLFGIPCDEGALCGMSTRRECRVPSDNRCNSDFECGIGAYCGGPDFQTCTPLPGLGVFCGDRFQCAAGFACDVNERVCVVAPKKNEPCIGFEFGLTQCGADLVCRDGLCLDKGQVGESCIFGGDTCGAGLGCNFDRDGQPRCEDQHDVDGACQSDEICKPEAFCNFNNLTCQPRRVEGESCADGTRCVVGTDCVEDQPGDFRCVVVAAAGDACANACPQGLRCESLFTSGTCVPSMCGSLRF